MKRAVLVIVTLASLAAADGVRAHAFLDRASPAVGSTVHGSPADLKLWFSQELEPAFSSVAVQDGSGQRVDRMDNRVDPGGATVLRVSLRPLKPGTYRVVWRVLSVDTHVTEGDFTFEIAP